MRDLSARARRAILGLRPCTGCLKKRGARGVAMLRDATRDAAAAVYLPTPAHRFLRLHASMSLIAPRVPHYACVLSLSLFLSFD